jgi:hypothetical protein
LKHEPSTVARSLKAISIVITLISIAAFSTIAYSAYADFAGVFRIMGQGGASPNMSNSAVVQGNSIVVHLNVTIPNDGMYPLTVGLSCLPSNGTVLVTCPAASVTIPPGGEGTLHFTMNIQSPSLADLSGLHTEGNLSLSIEPFASISVIIGLGSVQAQGA